MKTIKISYKPSASIKLVKLRKPVMGGYYAITKNKEIVKDGLCLDAANEVFNEMTK